jgi:hypothetical protein
MGFKEAIIIPLSLFKKCELLKKSQESENIDTTDFYNNSPKDLLINENLPPDIKLKLYKQQKYFRFDQPKIQPTSIAPQINEHIDEAQSEIKNETLKEEHFVDKIEPPSENIVSYISDSKKPYAESIISRLKYFDNSFSWNENHEIILNGKRIENSNIVNFLKYILKDDIHTSDRDIPVGSSQAIKKLLELGIPKSWILVKTNVVKKTKYAQKGHGKILNKKRNTNEKYLRNLSFWQLLPRKHA